ncbi:MAG: ABC transporter substrate-binding protein, partial [Sulfurospirillaceae bacterium]
MKRVLCSLFLVASLMYAKDDGTIRVAGPVASISHPIFKMIDDDMLKNINKKIEFRLWQNPDELRAMILKKEIDFVALPTNVAANLYNKNQPIKLTSVPVWGILEIVSSDEAISSLEDLKNEEIIVPFRADMPDIILQVLIKKLGYDFKTDYKLRYVPTPPDAMQLLLLRRA